MIKGDRDLDTICAISTPTGVGGISVLRLSGPASLVIASKSCAFLPETPQSHKVYFGVLKETLPPFLPIDEVLATYFQKGKSYTGEETIEISCHGSTYLAQKILKVLISSGARLAEPGEFTYRAFMNGNIDLVQAESVLSLVQSQSDQSARQAFRQLQGELSRSLEKIEGDLLWTLAHLEVGIDFSTEGVEIVSQKELSTRIMSAASGLCALLASYQEGRIIRDGLHLVLVGQPNVGKSSLLNLLAQEERAIVTDVPGTTRDLVEATFSVGGVKVIATDTAGLRPTEDIIEKLGIEKSYKALLGADQVFFVFDLKRGISTAELKEIQALDPKKTHIVGNKKDQFRGFLDETKKALSEQLKSLKNFQEMHDFDHFLKTQVHFVSAFDKNSGNELRSVLAEMARASEFEDHAPISQARHFENLSRAFENMTRAMRLLETGASSEFLALEMKEALIFVQETLGKRFDDQIMDRVFKEFCIGK
jgi:tRNA modification GTPase